MTTLYKTAFLRTVQIVRLISNTIAQTPVFVKHPYAQTRCLDNTTNRSVCQKLFGYPPLAGEGREDKQSLTKHSSKHNRQTKCLANKSVWVFGK